MGTVINTQGGAGFSSGLRPHNCCVDVIDYKCKYNYSDSLSVHGDSCMDTTHTKVCMRILPYSTAVTTNFCAHITR